MGWGRVSGPAHMTRGERGAGPEAGLGGREGCSRGLGREWRLFLRKLSYPQDSNVMFLFKYISADLSYRNA